MCINDIEKSLSEIAKEINRLNQIPAAHTSDKEDMND